MMGSAVVQGEAGARAAVVSLAGGGRPEAAAGPAVRV